MVSNQSHCSSPGQTKPRSTSTRTASCNGLDGDGSIGSIGYGQTPTPKELLDLESIAPENVTKTQHQLARAYGSTGVAQRLATEQSDSDVHYSPSAVRKWREEAMSNINADQYGKIASVGDDGANEFVNMLRANPTVSAVFIR